MEEEGRGDAEAGHRLHPHGRVGEVPQPRTRLHLLRDDPSGLSRLQGCRRLQDDLRASDRHAAARAGIVHDGQQDGQRAALSGQLRAGQVGLLRVERRRQRDPVHPRDGLQALPRQVEGEHESACARGRGRRQAQDLQRVERQDEPGRPLGAERCQAHHAGEYRAGAHHASCRSTRPDRPEPRRQRAERDRPYEVPEALLTFAGRQQVPDLRPLTGEEPQTGLSLEQQDDQRQPRQPESLEPRPEQQ